MRFYKKRLEKTIAFVLFKLQLVPNMASALQLINQGSLKINNKRVRTPNYICNSRDVLSITTAQGVRRIKLADFFTGSSRGNTEIKTRTTSGKKTK
jgi:ribosomal protein S4